MLQDKLPFFLVRFIVPLVPYITDSFFCVVFNRNMSCQQLSRSHCRGGSSENFLQWAFPFTPAFGCVQVSENQSTWPERMPKNQSSCQVWKWFVLKWTKIYLCKVAEFYSRLFGGGKFTTLVVSPLNLLSYVFLTPSLHSSSLYGYSLTAVFLIKSCKKKNVEWSGGKGFNGAKTSCGIVRLWSIRLMNG